MGDGAAPPYKPLKLNWLCAARIDAKWRRKSWISPLNTAHCLRLKSHEHRIEFISSIPRFAIEPRSAFLGMT
jgi:hypothetical protein